MMIKKGKLVRWFDDKGFGFIKPENGKDDIFIHISALRNMSRKPVIGDVIHYQISFDANGKTRAVNAQIEGVNSALTLIPLEQDSIKSLPSQVKERPYRKSTTRVSKPQRNLNLLPIVIVIGAAVFIYNKVSKEKFNASPVEAVTAEPIEHFQCEGKVWCSEMTSYEEAIFYLRNCPDTKMDGDGDGIPCERQF
ncbi:MAG: cold shock domain-containing protein [Gammaproteobacteria bacterium]